MLSICRACRYLIPKGSFQAALVCALFSALSSTRYLDGVVAGDCHKFPRHQRAVFSCRQSRETPNLLLSLSPATLPIMLALLGDRRSNRHRISRWRTNTYLYLQHL